MPGSPSLYETLSFAVLFNYAFNVATRDDEEFWADR